MKPRIVYKPYIYKEVLKKKPVEVKRLINKLNSEDYRNLINMVYTSWNIDDYDYEDIVKEEYNNKYKSFFDKLLFNYTTALYFNILLTKSEEQINIKEEVNRLESVYNINNMIKLTKQLELYSGLGFINQAAKEFYSYMYTKRIF
jgi:hypothetical protein